MKVIYHHRTRARGAEGAHIRGIQKAIVKAGYDLHDISLVNSDKKIDQGTTRVVRWRLRLVNLLCDKLPNLFFKILEVVYPCVAINRAMWEILRIRNSAGDVCFLYDRYSYFCFALPLVAYWTNIPLVLEMNTTCLDDDVRQIKFRKLARSIEKFCVNKATLVVVVSDYLKKKIKKKYDLDEKKILVTPNAVDPDLFQIKDVPALLPDSFYTARKIAENKIVIGFVGVFVFWHGVDFLVNVFQDVCASLTNEKIVLLLVGDGPEKEKVLQDIIKYNLQEKVCFTGYVSHDFVKYYIELFDIAVMPDSNNFGSPMKIFEYMIMGKPVVAPAYGPIKEVIVDFNNGLLFKPRDRKQLKEKILLLINDEQMRRNIGEQAYHIAQEKFTWEKNMEKILKRLQILNSPASATME